MYSRNKIVRTQTRKDTGVHRLKITPQVLKGLSHQLNLANSGVVRTRVIAVREEPLKTGENSQYNLRLTVKALFSM
jgi:hypothetical protein